MAVGDVVRARGTETNLEPGGPTVADLAFQQAGIQSPTGANLLASVMDSKSHIQFEMRNLGFAVNPDVGAVINIYARLLDLESGSSPQEDAQVPNANFKHIMITQIRVDDDEADTQFARSPIVSYDYEDLDAEIFIENRTGQTMDAGWILDYIPATLRVET